MMFYGEYAVEDYDTGEVYWSGFATCADGAQQACYRENGADRRLYHTNGRVARAMHVHRTDIEKYEEDEE